MARTMKPEHIAEVVKIAMEHHSTKITFNYVPQGEVVSNAIPVLLHTCCHSVIKKLVEAGFTLHTSEKGISVDKI